MKPTIDPRYLRELARYTGGDGAMTEALQGAADKITKLEAHLEVEREKAERSEEALQKIQSWCEAYPLDIFPEPDWDEVKSRLGPKLLTRVSASNMRHVVEGVAKLCKAAPEQEGE